MKKHLLLVCASVLSLSIFSSQAFSTTLFEGWYEVLLSGKKIGFLVERYEFNAGKFKATTYLKTNADGGDVTESLVATSGGDLSPINYAYTMKQGSTIKVIDANFKKQSMSLKINEGKKTSTKSKQIKKGTFLSTFLLYLMLSQKDGLKVGNNYTYSAIAEEDGTAYIGKALISAMDKVKGRDAFKMLNEFKGEKYFTWVSPKGEILLTRAPEKDIEVRFAENQAQAVQGLVAKTKDLQFLFGKNIPGDFGAQTVDSQQAAPSADGAKMIGTQTIDKAAKAPSKKASAAEPPAATTPPADAAPDGVAPNGNGLSIKPPPPSGK